MDNWRETLSLWWGELGSDERIMALAVCGSVAASLISALATPREPVYRIKVEP